MQTSALVDLIVEYVGSQLTRARALVYLNNAQNELLVGENRLMRVYPDPFITTSAGTYEYAASTFLFSSVGNVKGATQYDVYNITRVYTTTKNSGIFAYGGYSYGNNDSSRPYMPVNERASDELNARPDVTKSIEPDSADCKITFWGENDPGATTVDWRCETYRYPNQLLVETVNLETPAQFQDTLLLWMVLKRLSIRQFGGTNIDQLIAPEKRRFDIAIKSGGESASRFTNPVEV